MTQRSDDFAGQRLAILPRPSLARSLADPLLGGLCVSDIGRYPCAVDHRRERPAGCPQLILLFCSQGRGSIELRGRTHAVRPGQIAVIPPGQPHAYQADREQPWTLWWLHLAGSQAAAWGARIPEPVATVADPTRIVALIDEALTRLERSDDLPAQLAAAGAASHLLGLLAGGSAAPGAGPVALARQLLHDRVEGHIEVGELARLVGLSRSRFCARFHDAVGCPPLAYLTRLKMAKARELLDSSELPVSAIAGRLGYRDAFYFSRVFQGLHAVSPRAWRQQRKG